MEKNFNNFSVQEAMKLANSEAGQQLLALLRQENGQQLEQAMANAAAGDYTQAKKSIAAMLSNPQARALLDQLGRSNHE